MKMNGVIVYGIIIFKAFTRVFMSESEQYIEHKVLTKMIFKDHLKNIREITNKVTLIGGVIGNGIALVTVTYFNVDIITFTEIMLILNILEIFYTSYMWYKYLK